MHWYLKSAAFPKLIYYTSAYISNWVLLALKVFELSLKEYVFKSKLIDFMEMG